MRFANYSKAQGKLEQDSSLDVIDQLQFLVTFDHPKK
jgi:hypothetical protein